MLHKYKPGHRVNVTGHEYTDYFKGITENLEIKSIHDSTTIDQPKYWVYTHDRLDYWVVNEDDLVPAEQEESTIVEFKEEVLSKRVKCTTREQAITLLKWAHSRGKCWISGSSYRNNINWSTGGVSYNLERGMHSKPGYYEDEVSYKEALLNPEPTTYSIQGSVILLNRSLTEPTKVIKITENTNISFTDKVIYIDSYDNIPFDQTLLDSLIKILNNGTSNDLSQILN